MTTPAKAPFARDKEQEDLWSLFHHSIGQVVLIKADELTELRSRPTREEFNRIVGDANVVANMLVAAQDKLAANEAERKSRDKEIARLQAQIEGVRHAAQEALTDIEDVEAFAIVTALLRALAPAAGPEEGE